MIRTSSSAWDFQKQIAEKMLRVSSSIIVKYWEIVATRKLFLKKQYAWAGFQIDTLNLKTNFSNVDCHLVSIKLKTLVSERLRLNSAEGQ